MDCVKIGTKEQEKEIKEVLKKFKNIEGSNIKILQQVQRIYGYLPESVMQCVSEEIDVPLEELFAAASFYSLFTFKPKGKFVISVCLGTACYVRGADKIMDKLEKDLGIKAGETTSDGLFSIDATRCVGCCSLAPVMVVNDDIYGNVKFEEINKILEKYRNQQTEEKKERTFFDVAIYGNYERIALRNVGKINPENINEYIASGGYKALEKCLKELKPQEVIDVISASNLRGRGGGGFPTGRKWQFAKDVAGEKKYVICNADEGDPGAFMDRSVLEGDPHAVIEAIMIAGFSIGSDQGYIYVRAEYPNAVHRLEIAIKQAKEHGYLGKNIFGTGFNFNIELKLGSGAFVCGEETALLESIEGKRGEPRPRPPFPAVKGLFGKPTIINNVETYANIAQIILKGAAWFKSIGTEKSSGTKVFALGGKIRNSGLAEVPMGTTLREIIYDVGGGIPDDLQFKAAQTGGPSGGCIPASLIDTKIDYDSLVQIGCMMGSGGLIVMDEKTCMVDIAKFFLEFTCDESCGKCTPCRVGNKRLLEILNKITSGRATEKDLEKLEELCAFIKDNSLCGLGQTSPNPILSTLRYFRDEYLEHIRDHKCRVGVCKNLVKYTINKEKCVACTACKRKCPTNAITGEPKIKHEILQDKCIKCGECYKACKFDAVNRL